MRPLIPKGTTPGGEFVLYLAEDDRTRIQCRFENETIWLTQAQIAELFQTIPQNVTLHLKAIFADGGLAEGATCKDYLQVRHSSMSSPRPSSAAPRELPKQSQLLRNP